MLRTRTSTGWLLITHPAHGQLAGDFAAAWGNDEFIVPEPREPVLYGVAHHDDAWAARDAEPCLTREGLPSAFSKELVGTYDSFEEIDLEDYLAVRGQAAEQVAGESAYAAILVSMHTHNLLTDHVDRSTLRPDQAPVLDRFLAKQSVRRESWVAQTGAHFGALQHAFEFLQGCDSLSLITCVGYDKPIALQHRHRTRSGEAVAITCTPLGALRFRLAPYPFEGDSQTFSVPARFIDTPDFDDEAAFRAAYRAAPEEMLRFDIVR